MEMHGSVGYCTMGVWHKGAARNGPVMATLEALQTSLIGRLHTAQTKLVAHTVTQL